MARCTVETLMKALGLQGVRRGKVKRITICGRVGLFDPLARKVLWVADAAYVSTWSGWVLRRVLRSPTRTPGASLAGAPRPR